MGPLPLPLTLPLALPLTPTLTLTVQGFYHGVATQHDALSAIALHASSLRRGGEQGHLALPGWR